MNTITIDVTIKIDLDAEEWEWSFNDCLVLGCKREKDHILATLTVPDGKTLYMEEVLTAAQILDALHKQIGLPIQIVGDLAAVNPAEIAFRDLSESFKQGKPVGTVAETRVIPLMLDGQIVN